MPVWTVHRLDKETSGVILFALSADSHRQFSLLFENRRVAKEYRALVNGVSLDSHFLIDQPLRVNGDRRHRTVIDPINGKPAQTDIQLIKQIELVSVINAFPRTGYTHQIRAHLAYHGSPIINDSLYGEKSSQSINSISTERLLLHARRITIPHPFLKCPIEIIAPLPTELAFLEM